MSGFVYVCSATGKIDLAVTVQSIERIEKYKSWRVLHKACVPYLEFYCRSNNICSCGSNGYCVCWDAAPIHPLYVLRLKKFNDPLLLLPTPEERAKLEYFMDPRKQTLIDSNVQALVTCVSQMIEQLNYNPNLEALAVQLGNKRFKEDDDN